MYEQSFRRRFVALAVPNVLANLTVPLAGLVDTAMLGHLDEIHHLAGVALASVLFDYLFWSLGFLRMTTTSLTAQAQGQEDIDETVRLLLRAVLVALALGLVIVLAHDAIAAVGFAILGGETDVRASAQAYFFARIWGAPATLANMALVGWLLGRQRSDLVLIATVAGNGANIGFDYWFIYLLDWSSAGAGYATALAQLVSMVVTLLLLGRMLRWTQLRRASRSILVWHEIRRFAGLSGDIMVRTFALLSSFAVFVNASAGFGTTVLAANAISLKIIGLSAYFVDGLAFATESLAGLARGRGHTHELKRTLFTASWVGLVIALGFAAAFIAFPNHLFSLLTDAQEVLDRVAADRYWLLPILGLGSLAYVLDGYFIGLGAGRTLSVSMLITFVVGFLPWVWLSGYTGQAWYLWLALSSLMLFRTLTLGACVPGTWRGL